jgi:hypothetical protein
MTISLPNSLSPDIWRGRINLSADTFRAILLGGTYEFVATHSRRSDLTSFEIAATGGYTTGGVTVGITDATDTTTRRHIVTLGGVSFGTGPITARWVAYVKWRGGAAGDDEIIALRDFGRLVVSDGAMIVPSVTIAYDPRQ